MKTIPMLFQTELVEALLDGRKTVTRRPVKTCYERGMNGPVVRGKDGTVSVLSFAPIARLCPFGNVGDLIYVRETFMPDPDTDHDAWDEHELSYFEWAGCDSSPQFLPNALKTTEHCLYKANGPIDGKWTPSIHMPRWASRLTLKVTDVRIERVQDITEDQAKSEGIAPGFTNEFGKCPVVPNYRDGFCRTWNKIYNDWQLNPYVWVIEFEVIHQNIDKYLSSLEVEA
ncbi:hypothetical protein ACPV5U_08735 [Vibrio mediterranei]